MFLRGRIPFQLPFLSLPSCYQGSARERSLSGGGLNLHIPDTVELKTGKTIDIPIEVDIRPIIDHHIIFHAVVV